jgi:hypothetical protein
MKTTGEYLTFRFLSLVQRSNPGIIRRLYRPDKWPLGTDSNTAILYKEKYFEVSSGI